MGRVFMVDWVFFPCCVKDSIAVTSRFLELLSQRVFFREGLEAKCVNCANVWALFHSPTSKEPPPSDSGGIGVCIKKRNGGSELAHRCKAPNGSAKVFVETPIVPRPTISLGREPKFKIYIFYPDCVAHFTVKETGFMPQHNCLKPWD